MGVHVAICDPDGTSCVTLSEAYGKETLVALNAPGYGSFKINRQSAEDSGAAFLRGNLVQWTIDEIHSGVLFETILEEGDFDLISHDEEGGEDLTFGGRGTLAGLEKALLGPIAFYAGGVGPDPAKGIWTWRLDASGAILRRMVLEAQTRTPNPLPFVTLTWSNDTDDSNGTPWTILNEMWTAPIGSDLLTEFDRLIAVGQCHAEMTPGYVLSVYKDLGVDRTGAFGSGVVRFEKGVNISSDLNRREHGATFADVALVKTEKAYVWKVAPGAVGVEQFLDLSNAEGATTVTAAADQLFSDRSREQDSILVEVPLYGNGAGPNDEGAGWYTPGPSWSDNGMYWLGDQVTLHTGTDATDYNAVGLFVYGITFHEDETGELAPPLVELNAPFQEQMTRAISSTPDRSPGGDDPFFVDDPSGFLGAAGSVMAMRDPYRIIEPNDNTTDDYSFLLMENDAILLNLQNDAPPGSGYAAIEMFSDGVFMEGGQFVFDIGDTFDDSKYYFNEGWGIVPPQLSADPSGPQSEEGQLYWNTVSKTFRWFDGTVWADVGSGTPTPPFAPVYVALEMNTPPVVGTDSGRFVFDTYYDRTNTDLSHVLPADIGFASADDKIWECDADGMYSLTLGLDYNPSPGHASSASYSLQGGFNGHADFAIPHPNTLGYVIETRIAPFNVGQQIALAVNGTAGDSPINYAVLEIVRLG